MKLYYSKGSCSLIPRIIINELGLPCKFESVDLATKTTESGADFLQVNPKGAVPTLVTAESEVLTENAVILQYLADTNKAENLLPLIGDFNRYRVLEKLNYMATEVHKSFGNLFNAKVPQEIKNTIFVPLIQSKFSYLDRQLETNKYLCGNHFTLPDAYLFVMITWAINFKVEIKDLSRLTAYFEQLSNRESIHKSLDQEGLQVPVMA